jgi:restriction system protein
MNDFCNPLVSSLGNQVPVTTKDPTPAKQIPAETCNPHLLKYVQKMEKKDKILFFCSYLFCIMGLLSLAGYLTLTSSWLIPLTIPNSSWLGHAPLFYYILCVLTMLFPVGHTDYDDIKCGIFCLGLLPLIITGVFSLKFLPILGVIYFVGVFLVTALPFVLVRKFRPEFGTVTFASLCKNNPSNELIQDWWAYIQTLKKRSDLWTQELEAFLEHVPNSPYILAYYVVQSSHRGLSTVDALSLFNRMMTVNKTSFTPELFILRGNLRLSLNDDAGYEADYLEALKLNPKLPKLLDWDINRSLKKGLHQEALKKTIAAKELCLHENLNDWYTHFLKRETEMQNHCATNIQFPQITKDLKLILEDPTVNELNGEAFERLLKIEFEKQGFTVRNTPVSGDYGIDLILSTPASFTSIAVQVKRSSSSVGVNAVQEVVGGMAHYSCAKGMVITNAKFTKQAHALAASNSIHLIHS